MFSQFVVFPGHPSLRLQCVCACRMDTEEYSWEKRRKRQLTSIFLPGKSHGQRRLAGYSPCGCKELDMT